MTTFNYLIERKDRLIKSMTKAIDDSDDQHRRAFQAHAETVSYFIGKDKFTFTHLLLRGY